MNIVFGTANVAKREDQAVVEQYDFSQKDKTCTVAKMKTAWGVPKTKEKVIGMVDLVNGRSKRNKG